MMRKSVKIWLIVAASLVALGSIAFVVVMTAFGWDFTKLSTHAFETNRHELQEEIRSISVNTDTAEIVLVPSEGEESEVVCYERKNMRHSVKVKDGTLVIELNDTRKWYEFIGISFESPKITVSLPKGDYGALAAHADTGDVEIPQDFRFESIDVSTSTGNVTERASAFGSVRIKTSTGNIFVEGVSAASLDCSVSTGNVNASGVRCEGDVTVRVSTGKTTLSDVTCNDLISSGSTGNIILSNVIARGCFSLTRSTGNIELQRCDAAELFMETDTGNVKGTLLSEKVFIANTDTGRKEVPNTVTGGRCEINTDTGDIRIGIEPN